MQALTMSKNVKGKVRNAFGLENILSSIAEFEKNQNHLKQALKKV